MNSKYHGKKPEIAAGILIALLLVFLVLTPAHSQSLEQADSLMQEGYQLYNNSNFSEALKKFEESLKIYEKLNDKAGEAKALGNIGVISSSLGDHKKALDSLMKALKIYEELGDKLGTGAVIGNIGLSYSYLGEYTKALDYCQKALKLQEEAGDLNGVGADLANIGLIYYSIGDYMTALNYYQRALKIHEEIGYKYGAGTDLTNTGMAYSSLGDFQKALNYYQKALDVFKETGDRSGVGYVLYNLGSVYDSLGDYPKALDSCQKSLKIYEELGDKSGAASALNNLGLVYDSLGDFPKALDCYNNALKIHEETGDKSSAAGAINNIGSVYSSLGAYQKSLDYHQKALKIYEELGKKSGVASALNNIGAVYSYTGDYQKSLDYHQKALKLYEEMGDKSDTGKALNNIGSVYRYLGDYQKSLDYHQKALKLYEEMGNKIGVGTSLGNIGSVYRYLGDYQKSLDYSLKALEIYEKSGGKILIKSALNNTGLVYDYLGDYPKALDFYQRALKIQEEIGDKNDAANTLNNIGSAYFLYGDYRKALDFLQRALKIHEETGDKSGESTALNNIGLLYGYLGDYRKSLDYHKKALKIFEDIGEADGIFKSLLGMGIAYEGLKEDDRAIDCLSKSVKTLEDIRGKLKVEEQKTIFMQKKVIIYEELIELLLKKGRNEDAWQYTERAKARTLLDMLGNQKIDFKTGGSPELINKEEELSEKITAVTGQIEREKDAGNLKKLYKHIKELKEEYEETLEKLKLANPEYASLKTVEVSSLKEIQKNLDKDTLILEYFIGSKKSYLFIINKDSIRVAELSENEEKIGERISEILARVSKKAPLKDEITSLSNIIIKPALEDMKGKSKLVIIPHSVLHYIPFAMLVDSNGEYLVRNFRIITQPSASVWMLCLNRKKEKGEKLAAYALGDIAISFGKKTKSQKVALVRGTPVMSPDLLREGLPPLPGTEEEVEGIAKLYPGGKIFIGNNATIGQVKKSSGNAALLHFATHGILDPNHPLFSGLVFSDGILTTSDIFGLNLKAGMVVLSACNTAGGKISKGDEIVGLARAFMYAGTPTVVASLWSISDISTARLMQEFYSKLKQGESKEAALQEAQKDLMKNPEYSHPYYWAPFILIGDGK